jgi:hypothetical protein
MRGSILPKGRYHEAAVTVRDLRDADASLLERLVTQSEARGVSENGPYVQPTGRKGL